MKYTLLFLLLSSLAYATEFQSVTLEAAKAQAHAESRPVFVDFTAQWCAPCQHLDEYTFTDPYVRQLLTEDFISVQLDIESIDGYAYAQQYNVVRLPTMLLFDRDGKLLHRIDRAVGAAELARTLDNALANHPAPRPRVEPTEYAPQTLPETTPAPHDPPQTPRTDLYGPSGLPVAPPPPSAPTPPPSGVAPAPSAPGRLPNLSGTGLFRLDVARHETVGYSVQIGVYADYENVLRETANIRTVYDQQPLVHISELNGQRVFKLLLGDFSTYATAANFANVVRNDGNRDAFVKDLSEFASGEIR